MFGAADASSPLSALALATAAALLAEYAPLLGNDTRQAIDGVTTTVAGDG